MFWSVGPFWYMVYGIWYVVYGMKMAFTVYSRMFCVHHTRAVYNVVHLLFYMTPENLPDGTAQQQQDNRAVIRL